MFSAFSRWSLAPQEHLLPYHYAGAIIPQEYGSSEVGCRPVSPAPSDASLQSWDSDASPASAPAPPPHPTHVVCNAPLVAPVPLPYHSPTFLQYDDLPDDDEDLSHPPYTRRPHKRKRRLDEDEADSAAAGIQTMPAKRRSVSGPDNHPFAYRVPPDANAQALPLPMRALPVSIQTRHVRNARSAVDHGVSVMGNASRFRGAWAVVVGRLTVRTPSWGCGHPLRSHALKTPSAHNPRARCAKTLFRPGSLGGLRIARASERPKRFEWHHHWLWQGSPGAVGWPEEDRDYPGTFTLKVWGCVRIRT
ncbi:hypothetical protein IEO21_01608 [Rhodonia placenta]|uniref:Uncharacterized protein n=1 Tax=Rhodonia placenta TaxID=104341 RepID=A0A8H7U5Y1_9APHY|nr:hypothetical protein IEO21_01608 [Postia placenta]